MCGTNETCIFHATGKVVHTNLCGGTMQKHVYTNEIINEQYCISHGIYNFIIDHMLILLSLAK